ALQAIVGIGQLQTAADIDIETAFYPVVVHGRIIQRRQRAVRGALDPVVIDDTRADIALDQSKRETVVAITLAGIDAPVRDVPAILSGQMLLDRVGQTGICVEVEDVRGKAAQRQRAVYAREDDVERHTI